METMRTENQIAVLQDECVKLKQEIKETRPNHILHLLLSVVTGGLWLLVWALLSLDKANQRGKLEKRLKLTQMHVDKLIGVMLV